MGRNAGPFSHGNSSSVGFICDLRHGGKQKIPGNGDKSQEMGIKSRLIPSSLLSLIIYLHPEQEILGARSIKSWNSLSNSGIKTLLLLGIYFYLEFFGYKIIGFGGWKGFFQAEPFLDSIEIWGQYKIIISKYDLEIYKYYNYFNKTYFMSLHLNKYINIIITVCIFTL